MLVAGAVEVDGGTPRRAQLKVIEGFGKDEIHAFVLGAAAPNTRLVTDDWPSYNDIPDITHRAITVGPMAAHVVLPWSHRLFSNLKRWGLAFTTDCAAPTSSTTSTSSCSASIGAEHGMPRSIRCSASASAPPQLPTTC
jgi:ISXO2-like transposase domain